MLKIKDSSGNVIGVLKDDENAPEMTEEEINVKEGDQDASSNNINV